MVPSLPSPSGWWPSGTICFTQRGHSDDVAPPSGQHHVALEGAGSTHRRAAAASHDGPTSFHRLSVRPVPYSVLVARGLAADDTHTLAKIYRVPMKHLLCRSSHDVGGRRFRNMQKYSRVALSQAGQVMDVPWLRVTKTTTLFPGAEHSWGPSPRVTYMDEAQRRLGRYHDWHETIASPEERRKALKVMTLFVSDLLKDAGAGQRYTPGLHRICRQRHAEFCVWVREVLGAAARCRRATDSPEAEQAAAEALATVHAHIIPDSVQAIRSRLGQQKLIGRADGVSPTSSDGKDRGDEDVAHEAHPTARSGGAPSADDVRPAHHISLPTRAEVGRPAQNDADGGRAGVADRRRPPSASPSGSSAGPWNRSSVVDQLPFLRQRLLDDPESLDDALREGAASQLAPELDAPTSVEEGTSRRDNQNDHVSAPADGNDRSLNRQEGRRQPDGAREPVDESILAECARSPTAATPSGISGVMASASRGGAIHKGLSPVHASLTNRLRASSMNFDAEGAFYFVNPSLVDARHAKRARYREQAPQYLTRPDGSPTSLTASRTDVVKVDWETVRAAGRNPTHPATQRAMERLLRLVRGEDPRTIPPIHTPTPV